MVRGLTLHVGRDGLDLASGTRTSAVSVQALRNVGKHPVWLGAVGDGYRLAPGEWLPGQLMLGSTDALDLLAELPEKARDDETVEVHAILGYDEILVGEPR